MKFENGSKRISREQKSYSYTFAFWRSMMELLIQLVGDRGEEEFSNERLKWFDQIAICDPLILIAEQMFS